jgi:hypothetical protein
VAAEIGLVRAEVQRVGHGRTDLAQRRRPGRRRCARPPRAGRGRARARCTSCAHSPG